MAYLREAVEQQKKYLINQLLNEGIITQKDELHNMTIQELMNDYDEFLITTKKSKNNSIKFTRAIHMKSAKSQDSSN